MYRQERKVYNNQYYQQHKEKCLEYCKKYYYKNIERIEKRNKEYNKNHRLERKQYRDKHKEEFKIYNKKYYREHKERIDFLSKEHRKKHKEQYKLWQKQWTERNRTYKNFLNLRRRIIKLNTEGSHTFDEWDKLKAQYNYICPCCGEKEPFKGKFKSLTEDHIIPLSKGGSDYIENIQPLCMHCNIKKHTKVIKYVIPRTTKKIPE